METPPSLLLLFSLLLLIGRTHSWIKTNPLVPPPGNSLHIQARTHNGSVVYKCNKDGQWVLSSASATLVNSGANKKKQEVGQFYYRRREDGRQSPRFVGTWELINSPGDAAESGSSVSRVSGKEIASLAKEKKNKKGRDALLEFLAEANRHKLLGEASAISYIARMNTVGGAMPQRKCTVQYETIVDAFEAEFYLYRQDLLPPSVPGQLDVPLTERPVVGLFAKGVVAYVSDGDRWRRQNIVARLYNVPGGAYVGGYVRMHYMDNFYQWKIDNPNGFGLIGKEIATASVSQDSLPWSLAQVTSGSGNISLLGPFTHVQMVSTRGGLPPMTTRDTTKDFTNRRLKQPFTAIFWLYTSN